MENPFESESELEKNGLQPQRKPHFISAVVKVYFRYTILNSAFKGQIFTHTSENNSCESKAWIQYDYWLFYVSTIVTLAKRYSHTRKTMNKYNR